MGTPQPLTEGFAVIPRWVIRDSKLSGIGLLVLLALLDRTNASGVCWPSKNTIAAEARCSKRSVDKALEELRESGFVRWKQRPAMDGNYQTNYYSVANLFADHSESLGGGAGAARTRCTDYTGVVQELHRGGAPDARKVTTREVTTVKELTPIPPKGGSGQASKFAYTEDFTAFWQAYPRKTGKKAAAKAYAKAIKEGATPQELVQGAARLAADPNRVDQYTPHPATWLNQGRWEDETPLPARAPASAAERRTQAQQQIWDWATSPEPLPQTCQAGKLTYEQAMAQVEAAERKQVTGG